MTESRSASRSALGQGRPFGNFGGVAMLSHSVTNQNRSESRGRSDSHPTEGNDPLTVRDTVACLPGLYPRD
jgi:hypothetical protein